MLRYTRLCMAGLRAGIPFAQLVTMEAARLVMLIEATLPPEREGRKDDRPQVVDATQEDIDALLH